MTAHLFHDATNDAIGAIRPAEATLRSEISYLIPLDRVNATGPFSKLGAVLCLSLAWVRAQNDPIHPDAVRLIRPEQYFQTSVVGGGESQESFHVGCSHRLELHQRPSAYETDALLSELLRPVKSMSHGVLRG